MENKTSIFSNPLDMSSKRVIASSGEGEQPKYHVDNKWIKIDSITGTGLVESITAFVFSRNGINVTDYREFSGKHGVGCISESIISANECIVSAYELMIAKYGSETRLNLEFTKCQSAVKRIRFLLDTLCEYDIVEPIQIVSDMLCQDWIIYNPDRHFRNILFIADKSSLRPAPSFDNGRALLCGILADSPAIPLFLNNVKAKPFAQSFEEQVEAILSLGAKPLTINKDDWLKCINEYQSDYYSEERVAFSKNVFRECIRRYPYG